MENYGCVTYRETAILWDPEKYVMLFDLYIHASD